MDALQPRHSGSQPRSTDQPWLQYIEDEFEPEIWSDDEEGKEEIDTIRYLLLASEDDAAAVDIATSRLHAGYRSRYFSDRGDWMRIPGSGHGVEAFLHDISAYFIELASQIPAGHIQHKRLFETLINLKRTSASVFDPEDPKFVYDPSGLEIAIQRYWQSYCVSPGRFVDNQLAACNISINASTFIAKMFDAGMLLPEDIRWAVLDVVEGLETPADDGAANDLVCNYRVFTATQYILYAGETMMQLIRVPDPDAKKRNSRLTADSWREWAARLLEIAKGASDEGGWGLRAAAKKAHDKMVELSPELLDGVPDVSEASELSEVTEVPKVPEDSVSAQEGRGIACPQVATFHSCLGH